VKARSTLRGVLAAIVLAGCTSHIDTTADKLPPGAQARVLASIRAGKIDGVFDLSRRRTKEFDYLGFFGQFEVTWSVEKIYHHGVILRKKRNARDWTQAEAFEPDRAIPELFRLPDAEFKNGLRPMSAH